MERKTAALLREGGCFLCFCFWAKNNAAPAIAGTAPLVDDEELESPTFRTSSGSSTS